MNQFGSYVTRTAFQLSLSKNMIVALEIVKAFDDGDRWFTARHKCGNHPFTGNNDFVTPIRALIHRGLAQHHEQIGDPDPNHRYYTLTDAGKLVYQLCVIAGLIIPTKVVEKAA
jgi:hypothetical protein